MTPSLKPVQHSMWVANDSTRQTPQAHHRSDGLRTLQQVRRTQIAQNGSGSQDKGVLWVLLRRVLHERRCQEGCGLAQRHYVGIRLKRLGDSQIKVNWDVGFEDGRQYGRGRNGGQLRDDNRYGGNDSERGDYGRPRNYQNYGNGRN